MLSFIKASPASPLLQQPSFFSVILFFYLLPIRMTFSQSNNGTLCTVAFASLEPHPLIPICSLHHTHPFLDHAPHLHLRAQARGTHPGLPPHNRTCFHLMCRMRRSSTSYLPHSPVSSSQSLPRTSSNSSSSRKQQMLLATQRPIRRNSSWRTFHSCSACLAL